MKIEGTNVEVAYGESEEANWKKEPEETSDHGEAEASDNEELTSEEKARIKRQLGFDYEAV